MDKQRARSPEELRQRKQSIVDALDRVMCRNLYPLPSAQEIAAEAGVTKGVIYHYFNTKEEIYLTLLGQETQKLIDLALSAVESTGYSVEFVRDKFVDYCKNDVLMYLALIAPSVFEANVSPDFAATFKMASGEQMTRLAVAWQKREPGIPIEKLRVFLLRLYLNALTQWQHYHQPKVIKEAIARMPPLWIFEGTFESSLRECFDWLWQGMKSSAKP